MDISVNFRKDAVYAITDVDLVYLTKEDGDVYFNGALNNRD